MEIFYSGEIHDGFLRLDADEATHCVRVLRHRPGDQIEVIDGQGTLYHCTLTGDGAGKGRDEVFALIDSIVPGWHSHPYHLTLAVCPTKNLDRYEWMAEKTTEIGIDVLVPVIGERSERKVLKIGRLDRIVLSAAKQSLKGAIPRIEEPQTVMEFIERHHGDSGDISLIAYCSDEIRPRDSIMDLLRKFRAESCSQKAPSRAEAAPETPPAHEYVNTGTLPRITVLIGPEGDFSPEEVRAAMAAGFVPVTLGRSRLRTETAALTAAEAVYLNLL